MRLGKPGEPLESARFDYEIKHSCAKFRETVVTNVNFILIIAILFSCAKNKDKNKL